MIRILVNLPGVLICAAFLMFMAVQLNELALYVVCGLGVVLMVIAVWQDEVRDVNGASPD